jgi:class 3 adenylate cyclase
MPCPRCEADTPDGAKFCIECGTPLRTRCPQCGADVLPRAKFCAECGTPLTAQRSASPAAPSPSPLSYTPGYLAEKILTSKAALEGERKQVTVLFADLKSSMELVADRDPEEARQLLDPVLERMMAAVHRYEGTVNQVMGDGIMALFGAPIAHEDHAVRACYAALAMQASVHQYAAEVQRTKGMPIHIRVGLNSGEVVVRSIGSDLHMDYTAVGQTTHLAARMEQLAPPWSVRLTAPTPCSWLRARSRSPPNRRDRTRRQDQPGQDPRADGLAQAERRVETPGPAGREARRATHELSHGTLPHRRPSPCSHGRSWTPSR